MHDMYTVYIRIHVYTLLVCIVHRYLHNGPTEHFACGPRRNTFMLMTGCCLRHLNTICGPRAFIHGYHWSAMTSCSPVAISSMCQQSNYTSIFYIPLATVLVPLLSPGVRDDDGVFHVIPRDWDARLSRQEMFCGNFEELSRTGAIA